MSELPSYRHNSPQDNLSIFHEARVVFDPSEQLNELLTSFLNDEAYARLGDKVLELTLLHRPYRYQENDAKSKAIVNDYRRNIELAKPRILRVVQKWQYGSDKTDERPARNLFIRMGIGGTALARAVAQEPFYRTGAPLQAFLSIPREDLVSASEMEENRQAIAHELQVHPGHEGIYASAHYEVGNPRLAVRAVVPLRLIK